MATSTPYRRRFTRSKNPPAFQLTDTPEGADDLDILKLLAQFRFLNTDHIKRITGRGRKIEARLRALFHHGLTDRPLAQLDYHTSGGGSAPICHALGNKGAKLLAEQGALQQGHRVDWHRKNKTATRPFITHQLMIGELACSLIEATRDTASTGLLLGDELTQTLPEPMRDAATPFTWSVPVHYRNTRKKIGTTPDLTFALRATKPRLQYNFFAELDRGTMPVKRTGPKPLEQTSILRKFLAYMATAKSSHVQNHYQWAGFRVLMITSSPERLANMQDTLLKLTKGQGSPLFLFTTIDALKACDDLLAHSFTDHHGQPATLIPATSSHKRTPAVRN